MGESNGPAGSDGARGWSRVRSLSRRWVFLSTVGFLVANATVIVLLTGTSTARTKQSCGGFSGYSGGGGSCLSDLSLLNIDAPDPASVGGRLFYLLEVTNNGPDPAFGVEVDDQLAVGLQIDWITLPEQPYGFCSSQGRSVFCTFYELSANQKAAVTIVTRPILSGTVKNTATVSSSSFDPNARNNKRTQQTTING